MMVPKGDAAVAASATAAERPGADQACRWPRHGIYQLRGGGRRLRPLARGEAGYVRLPRVVDQEQLRGGAAFPSVIDEAIKTRTFRLVAVMSHASSHKANPERERQVALAIARERAVDFLIPLNMGLTPSELPFQVANLNFLPFMQSWAEGLSSLLSTLRHAGTPCFPRRSLVDGSGSPRAAELRGRRTRDRLAEPLLDRWRAYWDQPLRVGKRRPRRCPDVMGAPPRRRPHVLGVRAPPDVSGLRKPARDQFAVSVICSVEEHADPVHLQVTAAAVRGATLRLARARSSAGSRALLLSGFPSERVSAVVQAS